MGHRKEVVCGENKFGWSVGSSQLSVVSRQSSVVSCCRLGYRNVVPSQSPGLVWDHAVATINPKGVAASADQPSTRKNDEIFG